MSDILFENSLLTLLLESELTISDDELNELENQARQISQGYTEVSIGCCDILRGSMSVEDMTDLNTRFRNAANPDQAGNILSDGVSNSFSGEDADDAEENEYPNPAEGHRVGAWRQRRIFDHHGVTARVGVTPVEVDVPGTQNQ